MHYDVVKLKAGKLIEDFLRVSSKKFFIKVKFKNFFKRGKECAKEIVIFVQTRIKEYFQRMQRKLDLLVLYWDEEQRKMLMKLLKMKTKTKKQKEFQQKLSETS